MEKLGSVKSVGNGGALPYYSKALDCYVYQYFVNGQKKRIKQKINESKTHFFKRVDELKAKINSGNYIVSNSTYTLYSLGKELEDGKLKRNKISESTYVYNIEILNVIKNSDIGKINIQKLTPVDVQDFLDSLVNYANSYIKKIYQAVGRILKEACSKRRRIISDNFLLDDIIEKPKSQKQDKKVEAFTVDEQKRFVEALETVNKQDKSIFLIALHSGMRMGELLALKLSDVNLNEKTIHIQRTLTKDKSNKTIIGSTTKTYAGNRIIPITPLFEKELRVAIANMTFNKDNLIFTEHGKIISVSKMNSKFKSICTKANIKPQIYIIKRKKTKTNKKNRIIEHKTSEYSQHTLRHTYATRMIEAGVPIEVVQKLLGHTDIAVTINTYTTVYDTYRNKSVEKYVDYMNIL